MLTLPLPLGSGRLPLVADAGKERWRERTASSVHRCAAGMDSADKVLRDQADDWVRLGAAEIVVVSNDKQVCRLHRPSVSFHTRHWSMSSSCRIPGNATP
jgi:hypothetical protein